MSAPASTARIIRVFLASPGDVPEERAQARHLLKDDLSALPFIKDAAWLKLVAWDDPASRAPMPASLTPQEAIKRGMTLPSACNIVVVIFWSRMGTPLDAAQHGLVAGKRPYWSGTEWEYRNALEASENTGKPVVLVYRRTAKVPLDPSDPNIADKVAQIQRVQEFFAEFRDPATGAFLRGYTEYETPEQFGELLKADLLHTIHRMLTEEAAPPTATAEVTPATPSWTGSPFPGLRAFMPPDAPVFFGRTRETNALIERLSKERFVVVVGASGSGKSSLVGAGLIPRLLDNAIPGSKDWTWARFTPGEREANPFLALAAALESDEDRRVALAEGLAASPDTLPAAVDRALTGQPAWAKLLLFMDQFEELFTLARAEHSIPFADLLAAAANLERLRIVATLRADFYHRCVELPRLAELLRVGSFPLAAPELDALLDMIERPAVLAGLKFDEGLPGHILRDTGQEPGALALMAYALDELYTLAETRGDHCLTFADYDALEGVQGAIGTRAENTFARLDAEVQAALPHVFRELVEVDERGTATRQRAPLSRFSENSVSRTLIEEFTAARLLTASQGSDGALVEVAHEALFRSWPRLAEWIETAQDDLRLLRQVRQAAREWETNCRTQAFLWVDERLQPVYAMRDRLQPDLDEVTLDFIRPEAERLIAELENIDTSHQRRAAIGERLAVIGDPRPGVGLRPDGLPDIVWCPVPGGEVTLTERDRQGNEKELGTFTVAPFYIAQYPVTYCQFQAFVDASNGFQDDTWWNGLIEQYRKQKVWEQNYKFANHLRDTVSWYQAMAFCRWLNATLPKEGWPEDARNPPTPERGGVARLFGREQRAPPWEIRLPTEWEWFQAATGGSPANVYPWGPGWDSRRANTSAAGLGRGAAAGLYPVGASLVGALDLSGELWEWCLNEYSRLQNTGLTGEARRALRGGAYYSDPDGARCRSRYEINPSSRNGLYGFRVCVARPPSP